VKSPGEKFEFIFCESENFNNFTFCKKLFFEKSFLFSKSSMAAT